MEVRQFPDGFRSMLEGIGLAHMLPGSTPLTLVAPARLLPGSRVLIQVYPFEPRWRMPVFSLAQPSRPRSPDKNTDDGSPGGLVPTIEEGVELYRGFPGQSTVCLHARVSRGPCEQT